MNDYEGEGDGGDEDVETEDDEGGYNSYDEYVRLVEHVKHLESGESDEEDEDEDHEEVADEYEDDEDDYEEVVDDFGGFDTYAKYIENLRRFHEAEDEDARFRADLASAIAASEATAPPTTFFTLPPLTQSRTRASFRQPQDLLGPLHNRDMPGWMRWSALPP